MFDDIMLSGFGTEDSHHALHDFTWTPDGDLHLSRIDLSSFTSRNALWSGATTK